jgi:hypothetical protein
VTLAIIKESRDDSVNSGCPCSLIPSHPLPGHHQESGISDKVEHVIKASARIGLRPLMQLGLHGKYPRLRLTRTRPDISWNSGIHH